MKQILLLLLTSSLFISSAKAQSPVEYGITAEGTWFMPDNYLHDLPMYEYTFGLGVGAYASKNLANKLSADLGITYRLNDLREKIFAPNSSGYTGGGYGYGYGGYPPYSYDPGDAYIYENDRKTYVLKYVVLPLHLNYFVDNHFFIRGGIEASWLLNFDALNGKTQFNWITGIGYKAKRLKWSLSYIHGFKEVKFNNKQSTLFSEGPSSTYRNRMIQFSVSYPFFQKN